MMLVLAAPAAVRAQPAGGWLARGDSLRDAGAYDEARKAYERARDARFVEATLRLGTLALDLGRWGEAGDRFDEVLARDPDHLVAHLYRAIAHREAGLFRPPFGPLREALAWRKAEEHFERVLARDSAFQDVLVQYARLEAYRGDHERALALGYAGLRLRPDLPATHLGLVELYRRFLRDDEQAAAAWLDAHDDPYAAFFRAERLRRAGDLAAAAGAYLDLLGRTGPMPRTPVLLALARVEAARGHPDRCEAWYLRAVDGIASAVEAAFVFADTGYILAPDELRTYRRLADPAALRAFFRRVWARRDPLPAAPENPRLAEHYRRLVYVEEQFAYHGRLAWWNDPDKANRLAFAEVYRLPRDFNDRGLIYLRHGPPDDRVATLEAETPNESWRYAATGDEPPLVFHFATLGGAAWRLVPVLLGAEVMNDRLDWGDPFTRGYLIYQDEPRRRELDLLGFEQEMRARSQADVDRGLTTDRHTWVPPVERLDLPAVTAAFRNGDGRTRLEVHFAFPAATLARHAPAHARHVDVEAGLSLRTTAFDDVATERVRRRVPRSADPTGGVLDALAVTAPPDSYRVDLHVRTEDGRLLGTARLDRRLPAFSGPGLAVSDLLLAHDIAPVPPGETGTHHDLRVKAAPTLRFPRRRPFFVYFEIYHLTPGDDGRARYMLDYTLTPERGKRQGEASLTLRVDHEVPGTTAVEYTEIDASRLEAGDYVLAVTATDRRTGQAVVATRRLTLER
ncbi:MAG: hypothetical protein KatS3mg042_1702 [Rhodothermaceae bacterium]|nr:MAG: hypothetical protein KatS3mg042_1702 [Rhodothermaceae bacterium]